MNKLIGCYIVSDPEICHGKPTFRGTRIMVWQVLEMVAEGIAWDEIINQCHQAISKEAIVEALSLANKAFIDHAQEYTIEAVPA